MLYTEKNIWPYACIFILKDKDSWNVIWKEK